MKFIFLKPLVFLLFTLFLNAQVGVNTLTPAGGAILDIESTDRGVLVPRVNLTNLSVISPIVGGSPESLLVYNTNVTTGKGFFYWNGSRWQSISSKNKIGTVNSSTPFAPNANIPGPLGTLTNAGTNNTTASFDSQTITRTINVSGFTGNIGQVTCNVQFSHTWASDVDIYLQSPNGQIIELMTDLGGIGSTIFNVTFSDDAPTNITTWTGGNVTGTYRPEGTLAVDGLTPNITTMSGFNGFSPNGVWTIHLRDDLGGDFFNFTSFSLSIATFGALNYRLISETSMTYEAGHSLVAQSTYSANCQNDEGFITAITRSTTSAGAIGTTANSLPGTTLSFASDSPKQGNGNFWGSTSNQAVSSGLVDGTTYFFQLWAKVNVDAPAASNEMFTFVPMLISN